MTGIRTIQSSTLHFLFGMRYLIIKRWQIILRPVFVIGILGLAAVIGILIATGGVEVELLIAALVAPVPLLILYQLGRYEYGILLILFACGAIRFYISVTEWSAIVASLIVAMLMMGIWLLQMILHDKQISLKPSPINKPLLTFVAVSILAYIWGNVFRDPLVQLWGSFPMVQAAALLVNIMLPLLVLLVSNKIEDVKWLKWMTGMMIIFGAVAMLGHTINSPLLVIDGNLRKNFLFAINDSGLFTLWVGALVYSQALFNNKLLWWHRVLLFGLLLAWLEYRFLQNSTWVSGWLPLGVACMVLTFLRSKRLFFLAMFIGLIYLYVSFDYYWENIVISEEEEGSGTGRIGLWERNLAHIVRHPFFGMGPAGYAVYNMTYHAEDARSTHNNYFDIAAQTGLIGLAVFFWLMITFIRAGIRLRRVLVGRWDFEEAFACATLAGTVGVVVGMMLGDWVLPFAYNQGIGGFDNAAYSWLFMGGMISLYHIVNVRERFDQERQ